LEGITPEARDLAIAAARTKQVSVHEWLDRVVKKTAEADLADPPDVRDKTSG
jgi:hypothetical protein